MGPTPRVLVVGSGGREVAMCRALARSSRRPTLFAVPGSAGTEAFAQNVPVALDDVPGLVAAARQREVDFVLVGPEGPLSLGLCDALRAEGLAAVGPSKAAAQLEASKVFTRALAARAGVPGPAFEVVTSAGALDAALAKFPLAPVVKADGLAAGKGVVVAKSHAEANRAARAFLAGVGAPSGTVVLEERLSGVEASAFFACADGAVLALPTARDFKRRDDRDLGPNTGGMGAVSPSPELDPATLERVRREMIEPTLTAMAAAGTPFTGFLYAGLMLTPSGPRLLEFNVRLGDPETQAVLPRLGPDDFFNLCEAMAHGRLRAFSFAPLGEPRCCVVLARAAYPEPAKEELVFTLPTVAANAMFSFDIGGATAAGTQLKATAGRILSCVGRGETADEASRNAYAGLASFPSGPFHYRRDIR